MQKTLENAADSNGLYIKMLYVGIECQKHTWWNKCRLFGITNDFVL